ncbi:Uncharacterized protein Adt_18689 [Abeliophyllum distichum]|uniref:Gag-pol polyprotein n=1 Tax=Abeliophyllum distichum TaxID=126358 RepID=A0ABD1TK29_9LAMI
MPGRARGRPRINNPDLRENREEPHPPPQFVTVEQFEALQEQMSIIVNTLQRVTALLTAAENIVATVGPQAANPPPAANHQPATENPPVAEIPPTLRNEIERLISDGQLKNFVKSGRENPKQGVEEEGKKCIAGIINIIIGGTAVGGDSRNSRKGYTRLIHVNPIGVSSRFGQSITFNDEDLEGISFPHNDALVITGDILDFDVKCVLVDTGSIANVFSWEAFKALKILINRLKSINAPLQGFGRRTVIPEGAIDLPIVLGKHLHCVTLVTHFLVVRTSMAYNSIYGHQIINSVGAIISTQHQVMKFLTSWGVGIVR